MNYEIEPVPDLREPQVPRLSKGSGMRRGKFENLKMGRVM
jgi:hypothetical protein